jgi:sulfatase maturation enzyme AslB (radical SAM superfamily)
MPISGKYSYARTHSQNRMSEEVALHSMDFLLKRNTKTDEIAISFYGGERLKNFNTTKTIVKYVRSKTKNKVLFSMTTNGSLINKEILVDIGNHLELFHRCNAYKEFCEYQIIKPLESEYLANQIIAN